MKALPNLSPVLAAHHTKCQNSNELLSAELHGLYLAYNGPIQHLKSVRTFAEFVLTRHPERPGFRTYSE
jgi:hypothetical protein